MTGTPPTPAGTTVREATWDLMRRLGLTTVFGNPGSTEEPFLKDWPSDFTYVLGLAEHGDAAKAAVEAGVGRIRPVLMTALAMIVGMIPMSLSNTQNAPLGRAVIGGLIVATVATLLFVPNVFAIVHRAKMPEQQTAGHGGATGREHPA